MKTQSFLAEIKDDGQVVLDVRAWKQMIADLKEKKIKEIEIHVDVPGAGPSRAQLRFFHGPICRQISERTGVPVKAVKAALKNEFLLIGDGEYELCRSVATLSPAEMSEFIEQCLQWAAEKVDLVISDPKPKRVAA